MQEIEPGQVGQRQLVDVREQHEWDAGHAEGAVLIPMTELVERVGEIDDDAAVICRSGARSAQVVRYLEQQGRPAVNVAGGTVAWAAAGLPMVGTVA